MNVNAVGWTAAGLGVLGLALVSWHFGFFFAPFSWTGEPERLARVLALEPGMHAADIGAGSGALAARMAAFVGNSGVMYATELAPERRDAIARRIRRSRLSNMKVVTAADARTRLPEGCCEAIYMRAVFHHIGDKAAFAADVASRLRPGGRVAVIDFSPGSLWFHGREHGVEPAIVVRAFESAGLRLTARDDGWGGGMFLLLFERSR